MLAMRARVSPWSARVAFSSSLRATVSVPFSCLRLTFGWNVCVSSPLGPFTFSVLPSILASTPFGRATGSRPMRLISLLPNVGEDFPAQSLALGLAAGHETGRGRDDGDAQTAEDPRHLGLARVHAQTRLADAAQTRHRRDLAADVLHLEHELARRWLLERGDEALALEDLRDLDLRPRRRHGHALVAGARGVPHAREHVADRVVRHADDLRARLARRRHALRRDALGALAFARCGCVGRCRRLFCHLFTSSTSS